VLFDLDGTAKIITAVTAALVAFVAGVWKYYQYNRSRIAEYRENEDSKTDKLDHLATTVTSMGPLLADIQHELKANGGGSLRDVVMEIRNEHAIERTARRLVHNVASYEVILRNGREIEVSFASPAYVRLTGLTREETMDGGWIRAVAPEDRDRVAQLSSAARASKTVLSTTYIAQNVLTGDRAFVEHLSTPVMNYLGAVVGWVAIIHPRVTPMSKALSLLTTGHHYDIESYPDRESA